MAVSYPDAIGEHIAIKERFATKGLQYVGYIQPVSINFGEVANLYLFVQNMLSVPLTAEFKLKVPSKGFFGRGKPLLAVEAEIIELQLATAEAGLLTIPISTTEHTKAGQQTLTVEVSVTPKGRGERVRPPKSQSYLDGKLIDSPVGLNLTSSLGATYVERSSKKAVFNLTINDSKKRGDTTPSLKHRYDKIWDRKEARIFGKAINEINSRQAKFKTELTRDALYANLYAETVSRFANTGLPLRIGEAIILAKILTYTCQYFLSSPERMNGLLVPVWERALALEIDTTDSLDVIRTVGYHHLLRVGSALSFGLIAQAVGKHAWSLEERQAVAAYIADTVEVGDSLDLEFLYLPLLIAGTYISDKLVLPGEDTEQTLALIRQARQARPDLFADKELVKANRIYNQILARAA